MHKTDGANIITIKPDYQNASKITIDNISKQTNSIIKEQRMLVTSKLEGDLDFIIATKKENN
ncbi:MAG: hypothetical protein ABSC11_14830 [Smithella sp.]|jgi:hypothetical protein